MKHRLVGAMLTIVGLGLIGWALTQAGEGVWVSADGSTQQLKRPHLFLDEQGEGFDLSELRDGETRTFGAGAKQLTVTRRGDVATIERPARDGERELSIECRLSNDTCRVVTFADEPEKIVVVVEKERVCRDGAGDCEAAALAEVEGLGLEGAHRVMIEKKIACEGEGCAGAIDVPGAVLILESEDGEMLRCPEGDTSMRVLAEDASRSYNCPRHGVALERVGSGKAVRVVQVGKRER